MAQAILLDRGHFRIDGLNVARNVVYAACDGAESRLGMVVVALDPLQPAGWLALERDAILADALARWDWTVTTVAEPSLVSAGEGGGPHAASHQNGGSDEIGVAGLSGVLADPQTPASHSVLAHSGFPGGTVTFLRADGQFAEPPAGGGGADPFAAKLVQSADVSTGANITPVDLPGLVFTFVANGIYLIDFLLLTRAAAATTGSGIQINTSVAVTFVGVTFLHQLANTGTVTGGSAIADDASVGVSTGRPTANVVVPVMGQALLIAGATPGTAQLRYRSEVAAVSTCAAGGVLRVMKVN